MSQNAKTGHDCSRRTILKGAALASAAAAVVAIAPGAYAAGDDKIKVALIGCGRRGAEAAEQSVNSAPNVELVALADVFKDRVEGAFSRHENSLRDKCKVTPERCFSGFDAYQNVMATDADVVLLCAPPGFRPLHLEAAVKAGKHVFMEKPVAVDPVAARAVLAASDLADQKKLCIVAGTQRRHQNDYIATIQRIHDGAIGQIVAAEAYWIGDYDYYQPVQKQAGWSDMEWQLRNWNYFCWLSGDHVVEQHVHNLDVIRWGMRAEPVKCIATGSRAVRTDPVFGHIYDNFNISYEFPNGACVLSMSRQMSGTGNRVSERFTGTKGFAGAGWISGENEWKYDGQHVNPYLQEHTDLINAIRSGKRLNEGHEIAKSSLMAIMGRISAYTGREINYSWVLNASKLDLRPASYEMGDLPVPPVPVPGKTKLI